MISWHEKHDRYKIITGFQTVNVNFDNRIIRCRVKIEGYMCAYLIGAFNQWKKDDRYRLDWKADSNDGQIYMMHDIAITDNLQNGEHNYSYILVDVDGNEALLSARSAHFEPFKFTWHNTIRSIEIKASQDTLHRGSYLDLVAIKKIGANEHKTVAVNWSVNPTVTGIRLVESRIYADDIENLPESITISCSEVGNEEIQHRTFKIGKPLAQGYRVYYLRRDHNYSGSNFLWNLWNFSDSEETESVAGAAEFSENTDFGMLAIVQNNCVIIRKRTWDYGWQNEWTEQTNTFKLTDKNKNYYIVDGDIDLYTDLNSVIFRTNPRIDLALLDSKNKVIATLSDIPPVGTKFHLCINQIRQEQVTAIVKDDRKQVVFIDLPKSLRANDFITVHASNTFLPCKVTMRNFLDKYYYNGHDMGCHYINDKFSLRIWAPTATHVELLIYNDSSYTEENYNHKFAMFCEPANGTHHIQIPAAEFNKKAYLYKLYFDDLDSDGNHIVKTTYAVDPYAFSVNTNGKKAYLVDINNQEYQPSDWQNDKRPPLANPQDSIIYELHVRDFSIQAESGVPDELRGKFMGMVQPNLKYKTISTGVDSLVELGITHVHLLPIFDFSSVDESITNDSSNRNWGYDPQNYNVPEGSYSTNPQSPVQRILELRTMIHELHKRGIRVVMDMVYNHMASTGNMDKIVPGYYFRTDERAKFTNGSGCGNELATERPMVRKFVLDSISHWVRNYHIDGTRFDLMELMDFDTTQLIVKLVKEIDPSILVYGEPWKADHSPLTNGTYRGRQKDNNFAIFNDIFRDAIRGSNSPSSGFVNGNQHNPLSLWHVVEGLKGSVNGLTSHAYESINYADAHDNYTLWDQIEKSQNYYLEEGTFRKSIPNTDIMTNHLVRQNMLALAIILTAQGIPFFHAGAEMLRSKNGDHNSYKSDDKINQFNWLDKLNYKEAFDYVKGLIALRKAHPAFRMENARMINESLSVTPAYNNDRSGVIVSHYKNNANGDEWRNIVVIYNATALDNYDINPLMPAIERTREWTIVANHQMAGIKALSSHKVGQLPPLKSYSICILHD